MIDFKGAQDPKAVIPHAVFFYVRYAVSYRDLDEIMAERGVAVDNATLNRWANEVCAARRGDRLGQKVRDGQVLADGRDLHKGSWKVDISLSCR
jgi:transposase-like protein